MLHYRPERQCRKKVQRADQQYGADQECNESAARYGERARTRGGHLLSCKRSCHRQDRDDHQEAANQHRKSQGDVVPGRIGAQSGERAAVVGGAGTVGIEDFTQAMRPGIVQSCQSPLARHGPGGKSEDGDGEHQQRQHGHL